MEVAEPSIVVMQPTTLCNLDCAYCYLPLRKNNLLMSIQVAEAVADGVTRWASERTVEVLWHGGEPLAAGRSHLEALAGAFHGLNVRHAVQTNATLITNEWCDLFERLGMRVGVSLDGPAEHNNQRVNLAGRASYPAIMRGIDRLTARRIPFSVIAVVSDPDPETAADWYEFFAGLGCGSLSVNIEETEGANTRRTERDPDRLARFWAALIAAWKANPVIRVREIDRVLGYMAEVLNGNPGLNEPRLDALPTVAYDGTVTLLSPELAGYSSDRHGSFSAGNVLTDPLPRIVTAGLAAGWVNEFRIGLAACRDTCAYFAMCGGGHAANRHFEHGRLDGTQTRYCEASKIALTEGALQHADNTR